MRWLPLLVVLIDAAAAASLEDCSALPEGQRLACYDTVLGIEPPPPPPPTADERISRARAADREQSRGTTYADAQAARERRAEDARACATSEPMRQAILAGRLVIGMTAAEVVCTYNSQPSEAHVIETARARREQWIYGTPGQYGTRYLYLTDGVLTAIQD